MAVVCSLVNKHVQRERIDARVARRRGVVGPGTTLAVAASLDAARRWFALPACNTVALFARKGGAVRISCFHKGVVLACLLLVAGIATACSALAQSDDLAALNQRISELYSAGKYGEAIPLAQKLLELTVSQKGQEHPEVGKSLNNLALQLLEPALHSLVSTLGRSERSQCRLRPSLAVLSIAILFVMSGCSSPDGFALFAGTGADGKSADASDANTCPTPEKCAAQLKILVSDPVRDWIGQPQPPDSYANGTRLFAYRALKKKLTCDELGRALAETGRRCPSPAGCSI